MIKKSILALAVLSAGVSAQAQEANALSVTVDVTVVSDYVFRGVHLDSTAVQPSIEFTYGDFYAGVWHSNGVSNSKFFDSETDLYIGYGFAINETFSLDVGVTQYTYAGAGAPSDTTEFYAGISADVLLSPSFYYYYDTVLETSSYIGSIGYSLPVDAINASLDFSASFGWIQIPSAFGGDYTYGSVGVSIPYALSETATFTIGGEYVRNDTRLLGTNNDRKYGFVGSAGISIGF